MTKIRVLVVDDSVVVRRVLSDIIQSDPDLEVAEAKSALAVLDARIKSGAWNDAARAASSACEKHGEDLVAGQGGEGGGLRVGPDTVVARAASEGVVASPTGQRVAARVAGQGIHANHAKKRPQTGHNQALGHARGRNSDNRGVGEHN